ncbi:helix-turn-helix domain-containing protein [Flavobacterium pectinovorum]|uniref:helix-turn-helix domain-containing protein n=1 Tax=Flavobacterium pectinovorum TaxID=29533 RepID=UPI001FACE92D|nr:AraC family transcriptional regulator [Flavobacterium pectinovorum]MCI9845189.1 helix-turn-helix transcriptional regulator [Flavobacterium pectinovorum]
MKFKSTILGQEEPFLNVETGADNQKNHFVEEIVSIHNEELGEITSSNLINDAILIIDIQMHFSSSQTIRTEMVGEAVVLNFICCNNVEAAIDDVESEKYTTENTHNILYTSKLNATFKIPALEEINYLSIILSPNFYSQLINEDWNLHQKFSKNILQKKTGYLTPKYVPFNSEIQWVIHEIKNCKYSGSLKKMYLEAKIKELLILQLESLKRLENKALVDEKDFKKLLEAKRILERNFTNAPTLIELSRLISLNEFKLKKGFKMCFETTVKSYVTKLRMEYAKNLFKSKTSNVSEVAYKCGYKDVSHFSAAFKTFYGFTPISFRKINIFTKLNLLFWELIEVFPVIDFL